MRSWKGGDARWNEEALLVALLFSSPSPHPARLLSTVYDVNRRDSFDNLTHWLQEVEVYSTGGGREIVKVLVGNKVDKERVVPREEAEAWARSKGMLFLEASAKTRTGIKQVFQEVVQKILDNPALLTNTAPGRPRVSLQPDASSKAAAGYCC